MINLLLLLLLRKLDLLDDLNKSTDRTDDKLQHETKRLMDVSNRAKVGGETKLSFRSFLKAQTNTHPPILPPPLPLFRCPLLDCGLDHYCRVVVYFLVRGFGSFKKYLSIYY